MLRVEGAKIGAGSLGFGILDSGQGIEGLQGLLPRVVFGGGSVCV